jgi:hypothetical protein
MAAAFPLAFSVAGGRRSGVASEDTHSLGLTTLRSAASAFWEQTHGLVSIPST